MKNLCNKCGVETDESGDIHCRMSLLAEVKDFVLKERLNEAEILILDSHGSLEWERWKMEKVYNLLPFAYRSKSTEIRKREIKEKHSRFLLSIGGDYEPSFKKVDTIRFRNTYCYACKNKITNITELECTRCGWIICGCGACGCGYEGKNKPEIFDFDI